MKKLIFWLILAFAIMAFCQANAQTNYEKYGDLIGTMDRMVWEMIGVCGQTELVKNVANLYILMEAGKCERSEASAIGRKDTVYFYARCVREKI